MNSELGMLLPFAFVMLVVWSGTRIILARTHARGLVPPDVRKQLDDLATRLDRLEQMTDATATEVERVREAEQFNAQLLRARPVAHSSAT
jgi:hypothetical protein